MEYYQEMCKSIMQEYEAYQKVSELSIQDLSNRNIKLENSINSLSNIVEISKYINSYFSNDNLLSLINDMIVGILGVTYSTIFLLENGELDLKATNVEGMNINLTSEEIKYIMSDQEFLLNSENVIRTTGKYNTEICSIMGVPLNLRDKSTGYIVVEHKMYNFMTQELKILLRSIANQTAIALENASLYKQLEKITQTDPLLNIYNRKYFFQTLETKIKHNIENNEKFAIAMIDIDNFKSVNDTLGHQFGDATLIETTKAISRWLESNDIIARYGGEEIVLYFEKFGEDEESVINKLEIIRRAIEDNRITLGGITKSVTASFGVAFYPSNGDNSHDLIKCADELLYVAKKNGKNRVERTK